MILALESVTNKNKNVKMNNYPYTLIYVIPPSIDIIVAYTLIHVALTSVNIIIAYTLIHGHCQYEYHYSPHTNTWAMGTASMNDIVAHTLVHGHFQYDIGKGKGGSSEHNQLEDPLPFKSMYTNIKLLLKIHVMIGIHD